MDPPQCAVVVPTLEIIVQGAAWRQILRDIPPLTASAQNVHDAVEHLADIDLAPASTVLRGRYRGFDACPLVVRQVAGVAKFVPVIPGAVFCSPHAAPRESVLPIESDASGCRKSSPVTDSKDSK